MTNFQFWFIATLLGIMLYAGLGANRARLDEHIEIYQLIYEGDPDCSPTSRTPPGFFGLEFPSQLAVSLSRGRHGRH